MEKRTSIPLASAVNSPRTPGVSCSRPAESYVIPWMCSASSLSAMVASAPTTSDARKRTDRQCALRRRRSTWPWENRDISRIVDPRLQAKQRLREIDAEFQRRLQAAQLAVDDAGSRQSRRAAKATLKSLTREHQEARWEAQRLATVPVAWVTPPKH